jgi:hypothetical protein
MNTGNINVSMVGNNFPSVIWNVKPNLEQLGAEWYVHENNKTLVLITNYRQHLYVRVGGRLLIEVRSKNNELYTTIGTTKDLYKWGATTDELLDEFALQKKRFVYKDNPYFEVVSHQDESVLFQNHNLLEAVQFAFDTLVKGYA